MEFELTFFLPINCHQSSSAPSAASSDFFSLSFPDPGATPANITISGVGSIGGSTSSNLVAGPRAQVPKETRAATVDYISKRSASGTSSVGVKDLKSDILLQAPEVVEDEEEDEEDDDDEDDEEEEGGSGGFTMTSPSLREEEADGGSILGRRDSIKVRAAP